MHAGGGDDARAGRVGEAASRKRLRDGDGGGGGGGGPAARDDDDDGELALRALRVLLQWRRDPETRGYDERDTRMFVHGLGATCRAMRGLCVEEGLFDRMRRLVRVFMASRGEIDRGLRAYERAWAPGAGRLVLLIVSRVDPATAPARDLRGHHRPDMSPGEERALLGHLLEGVRARGLDVRHLWWQSVYLGGVGVSCRDRNGDEDVDMIAAALAPRAPGLESLRVGDIDAGGTRVGNRVSESDAACVYVHLSAEGCARVADRLPGLRRLGLRIDTATDGEGA